jgi:ABC-2 type transport system ATP-binding protein
VTRPAGREPEAPWGVRAVTVTYGERMALREVTLNVPQGQVTGVVGGDGAGKTTLLRILAGAAAPDSGEVRRPAPDRTGYLTATSGTYPDLSVQENLEFAAAGYGVPARQARARTQEYLERTGLAAARRRLAGNLSGGMRQKLGVIRAMLHEPDLLVLDEPTTGVDPVSRADLWWLIARAAAGGAAVVLTTTYLDEAERAASVLVLDEGEQLAQGTPDEIIAAVKGTIKISPERLRGEVARRAWRRGPTWRVWIPPGTGEDGAIPASAIPGKAVPGKAIPASAIPGKAVPGKAVPGKAVPCNAVPGAAKDIGSADLSSAGGMRSAPAKPDLQDAVIVAALARELSSGTPS